MEEYRAVGPLDSDQEKFSMLDRSIEQDQLPFGRAHGLAMLAYSPLALGLLTGKIDATRTYAEGDLRRDNPRFTPENLTKATALLNGLRPMAEGRGLTLAQLVIAWTLAQPGITHALVGARDPNQARENAGAGRVELSAEELAELDQVLARHPVA
jgi:aryl-alcohol dehydrogenase-like predicted oxidoreductase